MTFTLNTTHIATIVIPASDVDGTIIRHKNHFSVAEKQWKTLTPTLHLRTLMNLSGVIIENNINVDIHVKTDHLCFHLIDITGAVCISYSPACEIIPGTAAPDSYMDVPNHDGSRIKTYRKIDLRCSPLVTSTKIELINRVRSRVDKPENTIR